MTYNLQNAADRIERRVRRADYWSRVATSGAPARDRDAALGAVLALAGGVRRIAREAEAAGVGPQLAAELEARGLA